MSDGFFCPSCQSPATLEIIKTADIGADKDFDEVAIQLIACSHCKRKGLALYQESRRGQLDDESVDHTGYWLDSPDRFPIERA